MRVRGATTALAACSRLENESDITANQPLCKARNEADGNMAFSLCIHSRLIGSKQDLPPTSQPNPNQNCPSLPHSALRRKGRTSCHDCSEKWKMGHNQRPLAHHEAQFEMSTFQPLCRTLILESLSFTRMCAVGQARVCGRRHIHSILIQCQKVVVPLNEETIL